MSDRKSCRSVFARRPEERGQTIILVAVSMVALLGMAALAVDVVTLYVARAEIQRAADAAALAGAKAFVDSGLTTDPTNANRQLLVQTVMIPQLVNSMLSQNNVSGAQPSVVGAPTMGWGGGGPGTGNPNVTVTLRRTGLPTFFSRIWGNQSATVVATAMAEAYNPSGAPAPYAPIAPKCVKPLLIPNRDPNRAGAAYISDLATGAVAPAVVGEGPFVISNACPNGPAVCRPVPAPAANNYYPATANPANLVPSCAVGGTDFEQSIAGCDTTSYSCGGTPSIPPVTVDGATSGITSRLDTNNGVQCLIHSPAEDTIVVDDLVAGDGPAKITAGSPPYSGTLVTTSSSIATLPIFDTATLNNATGQVTVVGFLQVFIGGVNGNGDITGVYVLNAVGCGSTPNGAAPVLGGGYSPIPVRLIHQ